MKIILTISTFFAIFSCNFQKKITPSINKQMQDANTSSAVTAKVLLEQKCYSCHSPTSKSHANILAPPMAAIKKKYKQNFPSEKEFISKFSSFILNPTQKKAIGPTHKFGLMPKIALTKDEAHKISSYVFHNKLPYPAWLPKHWEEKHNGKF